MLVQKKSINVQYSKKLPQMTFSVKTSLDWPSDFLQISMSQKLRKTVGGLKVGPANQREVTRNQITNKKTD